MGTVPDPLLAEDEAEQQAGTTTAVNLGTVQRRYFIEQQMVGIPFWIVSISSLLSFRDLSNGEAGLAAGRVPIESFNMVTMNQMVPGVGPIIQFPYLVMWCRTVICGSTCRLCLSRCCRLSMLILTVQLVWGFAGSGLG